MRQLLVLLLICLTMIGCTTTQKTTTAGGLGGAAIGGIIGHQSGHGGTGAAIGGVVGALGGMLVGEHSEKKFCPQCGREYGADTKFCTIDGTELKEKEK